jgi:hypothetical protein
MKIDSLSGGVSATTQATAPLDLSGAAVGNYYYGELYYVKVRCILGTSSDRKLLGWLGLGSKDGYSSYIDPNASPPHDRVLAVQWVGLATDGAPPNGDQPSRDAAQASTPRYLRALNYPGGARFLGGSGNDGFYCYWQEGDGKGGPGGTYELTLIPVPDSNEFLVRRYSDNGPVYTYDDYYMGYWKSGNEFEITFEFIPTAAFSAKHENWMGDHNATIGARHLSEIVIPGSHDAGCSRISRALGNVTSQTQGLEIYDQLMAGSRYFDLRAWLDTDNIWKIYHGKDWSTVTLQDAVDQLSTFLEKHPREVVMASLLLEDKPGVFDNKLKAAWELVFDKLHPYHLNSEDQNGSPQDFSRLTPNFLNGLGKNLLLFSWGQAQSWTYTNNDNQKILASPWSSGPGTHMDLDGVFLDDAAATAQDIYAAYQNYTRPQGACWILHTNTPWQFKLAADSLYAKHFRNTPPLVAYFKSRNIARPKANIINIDYVGDVVNGSNLVEAVIMSNL